MNDEELREREIAGGGLRDGPEADEDTSDRAYEPAEDFWGWLSRISEAAGELCWSRKGLLAAGLALFCLGAATAGLFLPQAAPRKVVTPQKVAPEGDKLTRKLQPFIFVGKSGGEETVFKVGLALQFADEEAARRFEASLDAARRDIYDFLSRKVEQKSLTAQKDELQEAVRNLLNARFGSGQVVRVYFSEFLAV
jgi:flagellar basal body-associated protein FliL